MKILASLWIIYWLYRIAREDLRSLTIPDEFTLAILASAPFIANAPLKLRLLAALLPFALAFVLGMGDIKLFCALGFCLGFVVFIKIAGASLAAGGVTAAILLAAGKKKKKDRIAFGPFISVSCALYLLSTLPICATSLSMLAT